MDVLDQLLPAGSQYRHYKLKLKGSTTASVCSDQDTGYGGSIDGSLEDAQSCTDQVQSDRQSPSITDSPPPADSNSEWNTTTPFYSYDEKHESSSQRDSNNTNSYCDRDIETEKRCNISLYPKVIPGSQNIDDRNDYCENNTYARSKEHNQHNEYIEHNMDSSLYHKSTSGTCEISGKFGELTVDRNITNENQMYIHNAKSMRFPIPNYPKTQHERLSQSNRDPQTLNFPAQNMKTCLSRHYESQNSHRPHPRFQNANHQSRMHPYSMNRADKIPSSLTKFIGGQPHINGVVNSPSKYSAVLNESSKLQAADENRQRGPPLVMAYPATRGMSIKFPVLSYVDIPINEFEKRLFKELCTGFQAKKICHKSRVSKEEHVGRESHRIESQSSTGDAAAIWRHNQLLNSQQPRLPSFSLAKTNGDTQTIFSSMTKVMVPTIVKSISKYDQYSNGETRMEFKAPMSNLNEQFKSPLTAKRNKAESYDDAAKNQHVLNWSELMRLQKVQASAMNAVKYTLNLDDDGCVMMCEICDDKATGLHYGIMTCEGCKGFFKRTVQNKRSYTCIGSGACEVNKSQRNRCQYCRFKKCLQKGMVLAAVREDRMPGGRNSGALYNLYKNRYRKQQKENPAISGISHLEKESLNLPIRMSPVVQDGVDQQMVGDLSRSHETVFGAVMPSSHLKMPPTMSTRTLSSKMNAKDDSLPREVYPWSKQGQKRIMQQNKLADESKAKMARSATAQATKINTGLSPYPIPEEQRKASMDLPVAVSMMGTVDWSQNHDAPCFTSHSGPTQASMSRKSELAGTQIQNIGRPGPTEGPMTFNQINISLSDTSTAEDTQRISADEEIISQLMSCKIVSNISKYTFPLHPDLDFTTTMNQLGDRIVDELVVWLRKLPFYGRIPEECCIQILSNHWHSIIILETAYHQALNNLGIKNKSKLSSFTDFRLVILEQLHEKLNTSLGNDLSLSQVQEEVGPIIEGILSTIYMFMDMNLTNEEFVLLKVMLLLSQDDNIVKEVQHSYRITLKTRLYATRKDGQMCLERLEQQLPLLANTTQVLLDNKMLYIPFLLNTLL